MIKSKPNPHDAAMRLIVLRRVTILGSLIPSSSLHRQMTGHLSAQAKLDFAQALQQAVDDLWEPLRLPAVQNALSAKEKTLIQTPAARLTDQDLVNSFWRRECVVVLMWALRLSNQIPKWDEAAEDEVLKQEIFRSDAALLKNADLRSRPELDRMQQLAQTWHWRARTEWLIREGSPFPFDPLLARKGIRSYMDIVAMSSKMAEESGDFDKAIVNDWPLWGKPYHDAGKEELSRVTSIAVERHRAINWLCGMAPKNDWDQTPTDT